VGVGGLALVDHVVWPGEGGGLGVLGVRPELDGPPRPQSTSSCFRGGGERKAAETFGETV